MKLNTLRKGFSHLAVLVAVISLTTFAGCKSPQEKSMLKFEEAKERLTTLVYPPKGSQALVAGSPEFNAEKKAIGDMLDEAVKLDPKNAKAICAQGTLIALGGEPKDYESAKKHYEDALALDPEYIVALDRLGYVEIFLDQLDEAKTNFDKALALAEKHPGENGNPNENTAGIYWNLSRWALKKGDKDAAAENLAKFQEIACPGNRFCEDAQSDLDKITSEGTEEGSTDAGTDSSSEAAPDAATDSTSEGTPDDAAATDEGAAAEDGAPAEDGAAPAEGAAEETPQGQ